MNYLFKNFKPYEENNNFKFNGNSIDGSTKCPRYY